MLHIKEYFSIDGEIPKKEKMFIYIYYNYDI